MKMKYKNEEMRCKINDFLGYLDFLKDDDVDFVKDHYLFQRIALVRSLLDQVSGYLS